MKSDMSSTSLSSVSVSVSKSDTVPGMVSGSSPSVVIVEDNEEDE